MHLYDIHAHLADSRILPQLDEVLAKARQHGVRCILANAARLEEWPIVTDMAREEPVYGALGLHPFFLEAWDETIPDRLRHALQAHDGLRAVGEIGLDFYDGRADLDRQLNAFTAQLCVAQDLGLPVILHNRKSWSELFDVLRDLRITELQGVCHHFSSSIEIARQALDRGLYLSFCGPVTYPNARRLREAAEFVPLDRLLTETDAPDLPSHGHRGEFSLPHHVGDVVEAVAEIKGIPSEAVAEQVEANFRSLLGLPV